MPLAASRRTAPVNHLNRGPNLTARLVSFRLGRERFTIEVEDSQ
jgi:hypothetical protein